MTAGALVLLAVVAIRHLTGRGTTPIGLAAAQITVGALMLLVTALVLGNQAVGLQADVLALGALGTGPACLLNYRLIQDEGATTASTVTIVAVILGAIVRAEPITWNLFAGTAVVVAGVAFSDRRFTRRRATQSSGPVGTTAWQGGNREPTPP